MNTPAWCKSSWANISKARAVSLVCLCTPPAARFSGGCGTRCKPSLTAKPPIIRRKDGSLTGYGGGLQRKQWLLDHEQGRHQVQPDLPG